MSEISWSDDSYLDSQDEEEALSEGLDEVIDFGEINNGQHCSRQPWEVITPANIQTHQVRT